MSKDSSAKYQNYKQRLPKKAHKRYQSLSKEEKEKKNNNTVLNDTKICQKMKKKLFEYRKKYKMRINALL